MSEMLSFGFIQHALIGGLIISVVFGFVSFFIVEQRLSFLTVGVAHAAFGGVALGILLGLSPYLTTVVFCLAVALLILKQVRENRADYDMVTGIFFAATMALGIIFLSISKNYTFDIVGYLFGSILGIGGQDLLIICITAPLVALFFFLFFKELVAMTFDREVAISAGIPVKGLEMWMIGAIAMLIVISIKIIGIILVTAFLVLPASFALKYCRSYRSVIGVGILFSVVIFLSGFFLAYHFDLPAGATIVTLGTAIYLLPFHRKMN